MWTSEGISNGRIGKITCWNTSQFYLFAQYSLVITSRGVRCDEYVCVCVYTYTCVYFTGCI